MPATYEIRSGERLIVCTLTGEVSLAERVAMLESIQEALLRGGSYDALVDNRGQVGAASKQDLERLLPLVRRILAPIPRKMRLAIVVAEDVQYGVGRMVQIQLGDIPNLDLRIFRDMAEALAWLRAGGDGRD